MSTTVAEQVVEFAHDVVSAAPEETFGAASRLLLNGLRATLVAADEPLIAALIDSVGVPTVSGTPVLWSGTARSPEDAATLDQAMWTMLLLDDMELASGLHSVGPAACAALALAARTPISGRRLLAAVIAGIEVQIAVALAGAPEMLQVQGFAPLSVLAPLGAAVAGSVALGLDRATSVHAVGIAAMSGSGMWEMGGTSSATFLTASGTRAGLAAVRAASIGFEAPPRAIDGDFGAYRAYTGKPIATLSGQVRALGRDWHTDLVLVQPFSGDTYSQAPLEALALARAQANTGDLDTAAVESITVNVDQRTAVGVGRKHARHPKVHDTLVFNSDPQSRVAAAWVRDSFSWDGRFGEHVADPEIASLRERVSFQTDLAHPDMSSAAVRVRLRDGRELTGRCDGFLGSPRRPQTFDGIASWFREAAEGRLAAGRRDEIVTAVAGLPSAEAQDVGRLVELVGGRD